MSSYFEKSSYFVLGGCGFIGRNIVTYLVGLDTCERVIVADKCKPEYSWLTQIQKKCFGHAKVHFQQINLSNQGKVAKLFADHKCDYVINAAAETRLRMSPEVYEENIVKLGVICAEQAVTAECKLFIQISSARVKDVTDIKDNDNNTAVQILKCQLKLENSLKDIKGLKYCIIRPALVYGSGDKSGLTPFLLMGGIYKNIKETMELLWAKDLSVVTVHIDDVVRACIHVLKLGESGKTWVIADKSESTQGSIIELISEIFKIKHEFMGQMKARVVKNFYSEQLVDMINQKHIEPWAHACISEGINNTPLTPFINREQLMIESFICDGSDIESVGFSYEHPKLEISQLTKIIEEYAEQKLFPKCFMP